MSNFEKQGHGESIDWFTPPWITKRLGEFDLDPCGNRDDLVDAKRSIIPPADGLVEKWSGRVWMNPPFGVGVLDKWFGRFIEHGNGVAILPARVETNLWQDMIFARCDAAFFFRRRVQYIGADGKLSTDVAFASALVAIGEGNAESIAAAGFSGFLVDIQARKGSTIQRSLFA